MLANLFAGIIMSAPAEKPRPKKLSFFDEVYKSSQKSTDETEKSSRKSTDETEKSSRKAPLLRDTSKSFRKSTERRPSIFSSDEKSLKSSRKIPLLGTANKFEFKKITEKAKSELKSGEKH
jgi:hypothetical protein